MRLDGLNIFTLQNVKIRKIKVNKVMSQGEMGSMLSDIGINVTH
jgi:ribosomal protein S3AE